MMLRQHMGSAIYLQLLQVRKSKVPVFQHNKAVWKSQYCDHVCRSWQLRWPGTDAMVSCDAPAGA